MPLRSWQPNRNDTCHALSHLCFMFLFSKHQNFTEISVTHNTLLDRRNGLSLDAMHSVLRARGHILQILIKKFCHGELAQIQPCQLAIASYRFHHLVYTNSSYFYKYRP